MQHAFHEWVLTQLHLCMKSVCVYPFHLLWSKIYHVQWPIRRAFFAAKFCIRVFCVLCYEGASDINKIFFPYFVLQNIGALYVLQYKIIWRTSFWVWNKNIEYPILLGCYAVSLVVYFLILSGGYLILKLKALHSFDASGKYTPNDMVSHPRISQPSATTVRMSNLIQKKHFAN